MKLIQINTQPTHRQLKQFGLAWLVFFLLLATLSAWDGTSGIQPWCLAAMAVAVPLVGWFCPRFLRLVYLSMTYAAYPIGILVSHLILFVVYFGIITPTGVVLRLTKKGFFPKKPDSRISSYWIPQTRTRSIKDYFKPY